MIASLQGSLRSAAAGLLLPLLVGCGMDVSMHGVVGPSIKGSGVAKTETRPIADFTELDVGGAANVELAVGPAAKLEITTDDNLLPNLKTEVSNGKLKISFDGSVSTNLGVKIKASTPALKSYHGHGATSAAITGVKADEFRLSLAGASHATVTGATDRLQVECAGASTAKAFGLTAKSATANAAGASTIEVHAAAALKADASGASTIHYAGNPPDLKKSASGASHVGPKP